MSPATTRQQYRALVADVAARAKAKLPTEVNGRVESAARLVLLQDVEVQADGSILVGSASDPLKQYRLEGTACTCQDFTRGQAPEGWCQHRIAAGIAKRVGELLPTSTGASTASAAAAPQPAPALPEAPASVNVRLTIGGREVQWTLRDTDEARLAVRLDELLQRYPVAQPAPSQPQASSTQPGWCARHGVQMTQTTKEGRSWWSHRQDGQWCKGK